MKFWWQTVDVLDENSQITLQKRALILTSLFGILACAYTLISTILTKNVGDSITIAIVMLILFGAIALLRGGYIQPALKLIATFVFITIATRITLFLGLDSIAFYVIYPLVVLIGLLFRDKPQNIMLLGAGLTVWLLLLYILQQNQFYAGQVLETNALFKFIVLVISILILIFVLQISAHSILFANQRLVTAKEEALLAQTKAERASQAKSTFLANMSHELRTPLNAIIGYSEMIQELSDGEVSDDSEKIEVSAKNLLAIINSILEISKIEANTVDLDLSTFDVQDLITEVEVMMIPQIEAKGNRFETDHQITNAKVFTDRQKLLQILINLLTNANKFTENGDIKLRIRNSEEVMRFEVSDNGIGIPASAQTKIFEPFQQVDIEYNRNYDGAGLGLAICSQLANLMGAHLNVTSEINNGATFTLSLPTQPGRII